MTEYAAKNAIASSTDPRTRRLQYSHLDFIYLFKNLYRIQKFWGHMLRRHSNPTRQSLVAPANQAFGRFWTTVFLLVLMSFYRFSAVFRRVVAKLLHQKSGKTCFFSETSSKPGFDTSTRFFQGFG